MFLFDPGESPYDLRFRLLGVSVRVHPMFWLVSFFMGSSAARLGFEFLLIWIGCVFVSVLVHEMGHVLAGNAFGSYGRIVLYGFGGLAIGSNRLAKRWQRVVVLLAGPGAGFILLAIVLTALWIRDSGEFEGYLDMLRASIGLTPGLAGFPRDNLYLIMIVNDLIFINLLWGILNLLPIWPLDGGQIAREGFVATAGERGVPQSLALSFGVAALLAVHSLLAMNGRNFLPIPIGGSMFSVIFFGMFAVQSWQEMQRVNAERRWMRDHWDQNERW
ncbi:MAG: site-2 protease family protein [Gemmataceae bacterium]|nr:site-2 protease family protein [Gemmataceae bacterium]